MIGDLPAGLPLRVHFQLNAYRRSRSESALVASRREVQPGPTDFPLLGVRSTSCRSDH
jgi:hypothetical protein